jgi:membrane AbrB-like protein
VLLAASLLLGGALQWAKLPGSLMLVPLAAAVLVQMAGGAVKVPSALMAAVQAAVGCLVAESITPSIIGGFARHWPVFLSVVALTVTASATIGWIISRLRIIPGSSAVWGILPGAAPVMMMAEAHGADSRLVAFMQYLRVVLVAAAASVVALIFVPGGGSRFAAGFFPGRSAEPRNHRGGCTRRKHPRRCHADPSRRPPGTARNGRGAQRAWLGQDRTAADRADRELCTHRLEHRSCASLATC